MKEAISDWLLLAQLRSLFPSRISGDADTAEVGNGRYVPSGCLPYVAVVAVETVGPQGAVQLDISFTGTKTST